MGDVEFVDGAEGPDESRSPGGDVDSIDAVPRRLLAARGTWLTVGAGALAAGTVLAVVLLGGPSAARTGTQTPAGPPATPANAGWYTQATDDPGAGYGLSALRECEMSEGRADSGRADESTGDPAAARITLDPCPPGAVQAPVQPPHAGPPTN